MDEERLLGSSVFAEQHLHLASEGDLEDRQRSSRAQTSLAPTHLQHFMLQRAPEMLAITDDTLEHLLVEQAPAEY